MGEELHYDAMRAQSEHHSQLLQFQGFDCDTEYCRMTPLEELDEYNHYSQGDSPAGFSFEATEQMDQLDMASYTASSFSCDHFSLSADGFVHFDNSSSSHSGESVPSSGSLSPVTIMAGLSFVGTGDCSPMAQETDHMTMKTTEEVIVASGLIDSDTTTCHISGPSSSDSDSLQAGATVPEAPFAQTLLNDHGIKHVTPFMLGADRQAMVEGYSIFLTWKSSVREAVQGLIACNLNPRKATAATRIALELYFVLDSENKGDHKKFENMRNRCFERKTEEAVENAIAAMLAKYKCVSMDLSTWYSLSVEVAEKFMADSIDSRGACSLLFVTPIMVLQRLLQSEYGTLQAAHLLSEMSNDSLLRSELVPVLRFQRSPRRFPQAKKSGFTPYHLIKRSSVGRSPANTTFQDDQRVLEAWKSVFGSRDIPGFRL